MFSDSYLRQPLLLSPKHLNMTEYGSTEGNLVYKYVDNVIDNKYYDVLLVVSIHCN